MYTMMNDVSIGGGLA